MANWDVPVRVTYSGVANVDAETAEDAREAVERCPDDVLTTELVNWEVTGRPTRTDED